jgi:hypothetical protein
LANTGFSVPEQMSRPNRSASPGSLWRVGARPQSRKWLPTGDLINHFLEGREEFTRFCCQPLRLPCVHACANGRARCRGRRRQIDAQSRARPARTLAGRCPMSLQIKERLRDALAAKAATVSEADLRVARPPRESASAPRFRSSRRLRWTAPPFTVAKLAEVIVVVLAASGILGSSQRSSVNRLRPLPPATTPPRVRDLRTRKSGVEPVRAACLHSVKGSRWLPCRLSRNDGPRSLFRRRKSDCRANPALAML